MKKKVKFMASLELISTILLAIGTFVATISIIIAAISLYSDHRRRKKQATVEHILELRKAYKAKDAEIERKLGKEKLDKDAVKKLIADDELFTDVKLLLGMFENLCVGINNKVFSLEILNRSSGQYLINKFDYYLEHIEQRRDFMKNKRYYEEWEEVVNKLRKLRMKEEKRREKKEKKKK